MIDALIEGLIFGQPTERTGQTGKPFTMAKLCTATEGDALLVSVIASDEQAQWALLALNDKDAAATSGNSPRRFGWTGMATHDPYWACWPVQS